MRQEFSGKMRRWDGVDVNNLPVIDKCNLFNESHRRHFSEKTFGAKMRQELPGKMRR